MQYSQDTMNTAFGEPFREAGTPLSVIAEQYLYDKNLDPELLFAQQALMARMLHVADIDLHAALDTSRATAEPFSEKRMHDYGLLGMLAVDHGKVEGWSHTILNNKYYNLYIDAPTAIALTYKNMPQALVSMRAAPRRSVRVVQIQGVRPWHWVNNQLGKMASSRGLMPLHWVSCMLHIADQVAQSVDASTIYVQSASLNTWAREGARSDLGFPHQAAQKIYDTVPKENGYSFDANTSCWKKRVSKM